MKTHATLRQAQRAIGSHSYTRLPEYVLRRTRSPCSAPAFAIAPPIRSLLGMAIAGLAEAAGGHLGLAGMKRKRGRGRFAGFGLCATGPIAGAHKPAGGRGGSKRAGGMRLALASPLMDVPRRLDAGPCKAGDGLGRDRRRREHGRSLTGLDERSSRTCRIRKTAMGEALTRVSKGLTAAGASIEADML